MSYSNTLNFRLNENWGGKKISFQQHTTFSKAFRAEKKSRLQGVNKPVSEGFDLNLMFIVDIGSC